MIALGAPGRVGMEGRQTGEVAAVDRRGPDALFEISRKLRPERRLQGQIFAGHHHARVRQHGSGVGHVIGQGPRRIAVHQNRGLVIAHDEAIGEQIIEGGVEPGDLRGGPVTGAEHLVLLTLHHRAGRRLGEEAEGLGGHEPKPRRQQRVPKIGPGRGWVLLDAEHPSEPFFGRAADLQGLAPEDHAGAIDRRAKVAAYQRHAFGLAGQDQAQEFQRL